MQRLFQLALLAFLFIPLFASSPLSAASRTDNAVYGLAQQCQAIRSPGTGKYLKNVNGVFKFDTKNLGSAEHFFMKPTKLGEYLMTDKDGRYLTSFVPSVEGPHGSPVLASEWNVSASEISGSRFRYGFKNNLTQMPIQFEYMKKVKIWWRFYRWELRVETKFDLVAQSDCRAFPEITSNVRGDRNNLKGNVNSPVRGYIDAHSHITSYEFMGGKVMHGSPFHKYGVPYALDDSRRTHGPNGSLDLIGNLFVYGDPTHAYDTRGWPDFPFWPNSTQLTHSGYYYKWIERAWLSGLRMTTTMIVENQVLCTVQSTINPVSWVGANSCNTMDSIRLQVQRLHQMQNYIDAQYGGPGKGFFRLVETSAEARRVIADGKLAVVMGVEASETFNCGSLDFCNTDKVEEGLMELYDLGIRTIFPAHKFDNQLSGAKVEDGFINIGEALSTGHYYETERCDANTDGKGMTSGFPVIGEIPLVGGLLGQVGFTPDYEGHDDHCNVRGLTSLGAYLINRMIDLNMLIDLDHLSADAATQVMDIVEARDYSGVVSSHSFMHKNKERELHNNFQRMLDVGGFAAQYNGSANSLKSSIGRYLDGVEQTPYLPAVGIGTDMSGLAGQPGPRGFNSSDQLSYPYTSEFGLTFDRQVSGNRTFDYNGDGMAHYGMLADHLEDIRRLSGSRIYEALMNSAEGYLQMWERAEENSNAQYINPYTSEFNSQVSETSANGTVPYIEVISVPLNIVGNQIEEVNNQQAVITEPLEDVREQASSQIESVVETAEETIEETIEQLFGWWR